MRRARGAALLFAMWAIALLAALLAGMAVTARGEGEAARNAYAQAKARYAADAGIARAVDALRDADPARRWVPDGRTYSFEFDGAKVQVNVTDTSGQVDLNAATPEVLKNLFLAAGADQPHAQALADAVQDWRDSDDIPHPNGAEAETYKRAGLTWLPRNGPFRSADELARVYGMTDALYRKLEDAVTVYSGRNFPDEAYAGPLALAAGRDGNLAGATRLVAERRTHPPLQGNLPPQALQSAAAPRVPTPGFGGLTQEIRSVAVLPDGTRSAQKATLRLTAISGGLRPYTVLGWSDVSNVTEGPESSR
ncbi:MAG TPA: type II secretion system protein GspK [Rhodanobacteraceae bacterium]